MERRAPHFVRRGLVRAALACRHFDAMFDRLRRAGENFEGGLLAELLTPDELADLVIRVYDATFQEIFQDGLWPWEERWFERRLPAPPATLLVGAAGSGREALVLAERGYAVDGFDPAGRAVAVGARRLGSRGRMMVGRYEELSRAVLDGAATTLSPFAERRYDAVILGWGSLSHVFAPEERERALSAAAKLAPHGPVLASFSLQGEGGPVHKRSWRAGKLVGQLVSGRRHGEAPISNVSYRYGLGKDLSTAEIDEVGGRLGRRVVWEEYTAFPHVTLLAPVSGQQSA